MPHGVELPQPIKEQITKLYVEGGISAQGIATKLGLETRTVQVICQPLKQARRPADLQVADFMANIKDTVLEQEAQLHVLREKIQMLDKELADADADIEAAEESPLRFRQHLFKVHLEKFKALEKAATLLAQINALAIPEADTKPEQEDADFDDQHSLFPGEHGPRK